MKNFKKIFVLFCAALLLTGCSGKAYQEKDEQTEAVEKAVLTEQTMNEQEEQTEEEGEGETETAEQRNTTEQKKGEDETEETAEMTTLETETITAETKTAETKERIIAIDPGHSGVVAQGSEPLGPGSGEYKAADASGTRGVSSGVAE